MATSESALAVRTKCQTFINRPIFQRLLFEVCVIVYSAVNNLAIPLTQQYLYNMVRKKYVKEEANSGVSIVITNSTVSSKVEKETALLVLYLNMAELFPTAIVVLVMGLYSDVTGRRRLLLWLPCLANVVYGLGYLLPLYISKGDIDHPATKPLLYCSTLFYGLTGNASAFTVGSASYISDTDSVQRRNVRLSLLQIYYCFTYGISNYISSHWLQATDDYSVPFLVFVTCSFLVCVSVFVLLKEPERTGTAEEHLKSALDGIISIRDLFRLDTRQHKIMWCIVVAFISYCFVQQGQERTTVLFLKNAPLTWDDEHIGIYYLVTYLVSGVGAMPGGILLERCMSEASVIILAMFSFSAGSLMLAFARSPFLVYFSSVVKIFHQVPWAYARSLTSKQVGEDKQGSVYAVLHFCQLWMLFLGTTAYNAMFFATIEWMNGFVFAISAVFLLPSILFLFCAKFIMTSQSQNGSESTDVTKATETDILIQRNSDESLESD